MSERESAAEAAARLATTLRELGVPAGAYLHEMTVEPGDIDELGHVNNAVYVRWMDRAAVAHSAALGWDWARYAALGAAFVVRRHEIDYRSSALPRERVVDATWAGALGRATAERHHRIVSATDGRLLASAKTQWALVDLGTGRPQRIPEALRSAFDPSRDGGSGGV